METPQHLTTEQLYRAHRSFVARFLTRLGVRPDALDDAVQEVFVIVHRRGGYVLGPAQPTSYLAAIAIHTAAMLRRNARKLKRLRCEPALQELVARECDPGASFEAQQELQRLDTALARLGPTLRETLVAADGRGESCVAIAEASSVPLGTVYWRLHRARKKFRAAVRMLERTKRPSMVLLPGWGRENWWSFGKQASTASAKVTVGLGAAAFVVSAGLSPAPEAVHRVRVAQALPARAVPLRVEPLRREVVTLAPLVIQSRRPRAQVRVAMPERKVVPYLVRPAEPIRETVQLARAEALVADHPREALALLRSLDAHERANYLREERDYLEVRALFAIDPEAAHARAQAFLRAYPSSAFRRVLRAQLDAR